MVQPYVVHSKFPGPLLTGNPFTSIQNDLQINKARWVRKMSGKALHLRVSDAENIRRRLKTGKEGGKIDKEMKNCLQP
jgi:hypothetical protein